MRAFTQLGLLFCSILCASPPSSLWAADQQEATQEAVLMVQPSAVSSISVVNQSDLDPMAIFHAVANSDYESLRQLLNSGVDPNTVLPFPAPEKFAKDFAEGDLGYYIQKDPGFTILMFAVMRRDLIAARYLLAAGANPNRVTKRSRSFALQFAADNHDVEMMQTLLGVAPDSEVRLYKITISLPQQRATLWRGGQVVRQSPVSTGKSGYRTPKGEYVVTDKNRNWVSTIYHCPMPYFMRLSCRAFGLHAGVVPGYPASHGCIRLPASEAKAFFSATPVGTLVEIQ